MNQRLMFKSGKDARFVAYRMLENLFGVDRFFEACLFNLENIHDFADVLFAQAIFIAVFHEPLGHISYKDTAAARGFFFVIGNQASDWRSRRGRKAQF